ncbi:MAG TPA: septum site-determining protein MinD [Firmicutes bacterium]|nr:septum site-determining protein MinD [Bacillota bacterium]
MESRVIVITSGKGGVGKTTSTANVGAALAMLGHKVAVVDADTGLRNLDGVLGLEKRIVYDVVDYLVEKTCKLRQVLIKSKSCENLYLLPTSQTHDKDAIRPEQMEELCDELRQEFEFVLLDSPAGIEQGFKNAVAGADEAVIVTTPEVSAVRDADRIIGLLSGYELYEPKLILNRVRPDMIRRGDMMDVDDVLDILGIPLLGLVPEDEAVIVSTNRGEPVALDQSSRSGQAYRNIARRITGEEVPFLNIAENGLWSRLKRLVGLNGN